MNKKVLLLMALCLALGACAQKEVTTTGQDAKAYLDLYMEQFFPGVQKNADGIYILENEPGAGALWASGESYIQADVTIRTLSGTVSNTTDETLSKQLGTYNPAYYYGPKWMTVGEGLSYAGVDALLSGMRMGGTRTAIIPAWMLTTSRYSSEAEYIAACTSSTHLEYTIGLKAQTTDIDALEKEQLTAYVNGHFGADKQPGSFVKDEEPDGRFYFISDVSAFEEATPLKAGDTFLINYTGKLLDGRIFDTSIEKVAKDAGIYSADRTYEPVSIVQATAYDSITMDGSSSLINGFKGGLYLLQYKGQKATVLFTSAYGYSSSGNSSIPGYSPLIFELEVIDN